MQGELVHHRQYLEKALEIITAGLHVVILVLRIFYIYLLIMKS